MFEQRFNETLHTATTVSLLSDYLYKLPRFVLTKTYVLKICPAVWNKHIYWNKSVKKNTFPQV